MTLESMVALGATITTLALAPFLYIWKSTMARLEELEKKSKDCASRDEVKDLIKESQEATKEDLDEIKARLDKIIDRLIDQK